MGVNINRGGTIYTGAPDWAQNVHGKIIGYSNQYTTFVSLGLNGLIYKAYRSEYNKQASLFVVQVSMYIGDQ